MKKPFEVQYGLVIDVLRSLAVGVVSGTFLIFVIHVPIAIVTNRFITSRGAGGAVAVQPACDPVRAAIQSGALFPREQMIASHRKSNPPRMESGTLPGWVSRRMGSAAVHQQRETAGVSLRIGQSERFCLVTAVLRGVDALKSDALERRSADLYRAVRQELASTATPHPVRFWNYLPRIGAKNEDTTDRYMTFNAGRFAAFREWFGGPEAFGRLVPAASAVGHEGEDLILHALACAQPGRAVANPHQVAPYHYSQRFGPLPPCFARATVIEHANESPLILVGGTASIRGEDSLHAGSLQRQAGETFENLACLVASACGEKGCASLDRALWLSRFRELRVYYPRPTDLSTIETLVSEAFPDLAGVEYVRADLCRSELLIEIEGVATGG